ncbi:MAG: preprotein translocase subunit SecA [Alphaproteobacteria bacterium GM202ARS2]|nr:preprotein translocase subunit SecA [Alphaproteobacteria bacterium GM202ARS2]
MIVSWAKKMFGDSSVRFLRSKRGLVVAINEHEASVRALSDDDLRAGSLALRQRVTQGAPVDESVLVEAFAYVREAAVRTLGQRHYDVQLLGGLVLHDGRIAEMKTGEGKTLVATLAVYANALGGKGVHVVTVNDYLAKRDSQWMGAIYRFLGLSVGCLTNDMPVAERAQAYGCDVLYATNNELGFDYLRDNMAHQVSSLVQRPFHYGIVDEVDSILIDEARTPLIISGASSDSSALYRSVNPIVAKLGEGDYEKDEKMRAVSLTDKGTERIEGWLQEAELLQGGLYDVGNISIVHHVQQALRAHTMFQRDVDYIVRQGRVMIIDEFTGRMMEGRRYSDGLHQALEAKENVEVQVENQTLASITFQNYFRLYPKLAGMTGTAMTERAEFSAIYAMDVVAVPTHRPFVRADYDDEIYRRNEDKQRALVALIKECFERHQPVLVGTTSIEKSEALSALLKKEGIAHHVLNARYHEQEAQIIAKAGCSGAVTIATNMAGRGTDIQLGGNVEMLVAQGIDNKPEAAHGALIEGIKAEIEADKKKAIEAGGLYVIGTERHESRRIDNQLRGRSGRQGDSGASRFFLSLEDDLMRIFGGEKLDRMMERFGIDGSEAITHPWVNRAIAKAQERVENNNFEVRKHLLRYDDVMNDQRKVIYEQRRDLIASEDVAETVRDMRHEVIEDLVTECVPEKAYAEEWDIEKLEKETKRLLALDEPVADWAKEEGVADAEIRERLIEASDRKIAQKTVSYGAPMIRSAEKSLLLQILDHLWKDHLLQLDHLRQGIHLRGYGQRDPLNEYKREAFSLFEGLLNNLRQTVTQVLSHLEIRAAQSEQETADAEEEPVLAATGTDGMPAPAPRRSSGGAAPAVAAVAGSSSQASSGQAKSAKVPRNAPCPCGSGKKYKHCHGKL